MASYFEADVQHIKEEDKKRINFLDRRKFRGQQSEFEKTLKTLIETFLFFGVTDSIKVSNQLMSIKLIYQLNKNLLVMTYLYFKKKGFELSNTFLNFDEDFQEILNTASRYGIFKKLFDKKMEYSFRQDFIIYLFILNDFKEEIESSESSSEYYEDSLDYTMEDIYDEAEKMPKDNMDYAE